MRKQKTQRINPKCDSVKSESKTHRFLSQIAIPVFTTKLLNIHILTFQTNGVNSSVEKDQETGDDCALQDEMEA